MASGTPVEPLRGRAAFDALRRAGHRSRQAPLTLIELPGTLGDPVRVSYSIGRRVGGAVTRNRLRRRLRAIVVDIDPAPGSYLIGADPAAARASFAELDTAVRRLVRPAVRSRS